MARGMVKRAFITTVMQRQLGTLACYFQVYPFFSWSDGCTSELAYAYPLAAKQHFTLHGVCSEWEEGPAETAARLTWREQNVQRVIKLGSGNEMPWASQERSRHSRMDT